MFIFLPLALADIPPIPPTGKVFVTHTVQIAGLSDHPEHVLLLYAASEEISQHRVFKDDSPVEIDGELRSADFWVMSRPGYDAWAEAARAEVKRQLIACEERGEGCVHSSRFEPRLVPPGDSIRCGVTLSAPSSVPSGEPTSQLHAFLLQTASATECVLSPAEAAPAPASDPEVPASDPVEPSPAAPEPEVSPDRAGCATVSGASLVAIGLSMMLGLRRRCGS